jgi:predicted dehydrogenase
MERHRVGVIGCGGIGVQHVNGIVGMDSAELVAGCDLNEDTLAAFGERWADTWPNVTRYTDYREMLEREHLDVITIATPDNRHVDPVVDAANAGVNAIFCEKPLATSLADADRMRAAVEENNVLFSVDHTRRWIPLWRHMVEEVIAGGQVGEVQYVVGTLSGKRGSLFRNGTHLIDGICYLAGSDPDWVFAELERGYEDHTEYRGDGGSDPSLEPSASGYIHFANGVRGFYTGTSKRTAGPKWHFEVMGSEGQIIVDKQATLIRGGKSEVIVAPEAPLSGIPAGVRELVEALDAGGQTSSPMSAAMNVVEVIFGFLESQRLGNVRVDLPVPRESA